MIVTFLLLLVLKVVDVLLCHSIGSQICFSSFLPLNISVFVNIVIDEGTSHIQYETMTHCSKNYSKLDYSKDVFENLVTVFIASHHSLFINDITYSIHFTQKSGCFFFDVY